MIKEHVKLLVSTKATLLEEKVEKTLEELREDGYDIVCVTSNISYAGDKGYMILCQIDYNEEIPNDNIDIPDYDAGIDFGAGMSFEGGPSNE